LCTWIDYVSVGDRHRFDANPDPNFHDDAVPDPTRMRVGIRTMPIPMRILPQVLQLLENQNFLVFF
jgi:hypothetical protein